jgi:DUF1009 family protein
MGTLGIIAGGGELPVAIAHSARDAGRDVFVLAMAGASDELSEFRREDVGIGELGRTLSLLKKHNVDELTFAGNVARPDWKSIKLDARGILAFPKVLSAVVKGDNAIMSSVLGIFEKEGVRVIGTADAAPNLVADQGIYGRHEPSEQSLADIKLAREVIQRMGELDIGQATAVCDGLVLAVEAAEGTDAMLARIPSLSKNQRGTLEKRRGVLVKAPKPNQERRVDLPVIGMRTVDLASGAGLVGIAVEAGAALIMRKDKIVAKADELGLFVMAFDASV